MNVQDRMNGGPAATDLFPGDAPAAWDAAPLGAAQTSPGMFGDDRVGIIYQRPVFGAEPFEPPQTPQFPGSFGGSGGIGAILSQLFGILGQLLSSLGLSGGAYGNGGSFFSNATASSAGDPHLAFNGTTQNGTTQQNHYDSMTGHHDLLDSDSFEGGYRVSTAVTQPAANGVTYNRRASVSTNFGDTRVSLDKDGDATVVQNGQTTALSDGQTVALGGGETVTRNADGSLSIVDANGAGGSITTTMRENGNGVDVNVQAQDVDLGGDLTQQL